MNRGGSLRRRLSSLRGAWRWSTGYLFRKVGCKVWILSTLAQWLLVLYLLLLFLCFGKACLVSSRTFTSPQRLLPSLCSCFALSQMVNLNGLLVKSTSTDGFHLETGLLDPPPPTSSPSSPSPTTSPPALVLDASSPRRETGLQAFSESASEQLQWGNWFDLNTNGPCFLLLRCTSLAASIGKKLKQCFVFCSYHCQKFLILKHHGVNKERT